MEDVEAVDRSGPPATGSQQPSSIGSLRLVDVPTDGSCWLYAAMLGQLVLQETPWSEVSSARGSGNASDWCRKMRWNIAELIADVAAEKREWKGQAPKPTYAIIASEARNREGFFRSGHASWHQVEQRKADATDRQLTQWYVDMLALHAYSQSSGEPEVAEGRPHAYGDETALDALGQLNDLEIEIYQPVGNWGVRLCSTLGVRGGIKVMLLHVTAQRPSNAYGVGNHYKLLLDRHSSGRLPHHEMVAFTRQTD